MLISLAGHTFSMPIEMKNGFKEYEPFILKDNNISHKELFSMSIIENMPDKPSDGYILGDFTDDNGRCKVYNYPDNYIFENFEPQKTEPYLTIRCSKDFTEASMYIHNSQTEALAVSNALMMLYTFASSAHNTILFHSSVVVHKGIAYMFLGKSGTGKSTHSRMWLQNIEQTHLLNDDNPVVRIIDGKAWVFGSPWSGKTPCYRCEAYPIGGIIRIWQRPENSIKKLRPMEALAAILPTVSKLPSVDMVHNGVLNTIEKLIETVPIYSLGCLPNADAAKVCCEAVVK